MSEKDVGQTSAEARGFFESGRKAAETSNFDYAIDMYIKGLRCAPDSVQEGHIKLRELALRRQGQRGAKPSAAEVAERLRGETALERMLGAEYLLAKDPGHMPYAEAILKAAVAGDYKEAAKWIADLMFLANKNAKKPSLQIYLLLKDSYAAIGQLERAVAACECATKLKRDDVALAEELRRLLAKRAVAKGEYERGGLLEAGDYGLLAVAEAREGNPGRFVPEGDIDSALVKAKVFFERARAVAETNNFDYAINMYLEGLRCAPDALEDGHLPLCELALHRQGKGGKKPSMMEKVKRMRGKTPLEQMLNAEYLFAKAPDHLPYAEAMLKAAVAGGYNKTAKWLANLVFQTNNAAKKPSLQTYLLLKDSYDALGEIDKALVACQCATRLKPEDGELADEFKRLSAELTVARGKYDHEGDFRQSIKDRELQEKLQAQQKVVKTQDYRVTAVEEARGALEREPDSPKNIFYLAETLSDLQEDKAENEAIELLENMYKEKSDFSFKQRSGQLRIRQIKRKIRDVNKGIEKDGGDAQAKSELSRLSAELNSTELEHYRLCVENYPTDLRAKYDYGVRLVRNERYDEAIPLFQEAQRDPRNKISAMGKIGLCFFMKGWFSDAIDVLTQAIDAYEIKDSGIAKELRYNLGRSYEEQGDTEKALVVYHKIAQLDFGYKDVRQRIDKLRGK